jgi:tetratricopeptide (TPR) repeat protein
MQKEDADTDARKLDDHIAKVADLTLTHVDKNMGFLTALWTALAFAGAALATVLAWFGVRSIRDVQSARKKLDTEVQEVRAAKEELRTEIQKLTEEKEKLLAEASGHHKVMMRTTQAQIVAMRDDPSRPLTAEERRHYERLSSQLDRVLRDHPPSDDGIASWALSVQAYFKFRLGKLSDAYDAAKESTARQQEKNGPAHYNAACIAARLGLEDKALDHLRAAIEAAEHYREDAKTDSDFESLRKNRTSAFSALVGQV